MTVFTLYYYNKSGYILSADVLGVLFGFWGGELLVVALRQMIGSDVITKAKEEKKKDESEGETI